MPAKATINPAVKVYELENQLQDFRWMKKQAVMYFHWSMQDFDDADYFEMLEMMSAKDKKDRPIDPAIMWEQYQEKGWLKWHNKLTQQWAPRLPLTYCRQANPSNH